MSQSSILHTLFFCSTVTICFSQTKQIDSLQNLLTATNDTTQINSLRRLGTQFRFKDKEKAIEYGLRSLEKSREINYALGEIAALYDLGLTYGMTGEYPEALDFFNQCASLALKNKNYEFANKSYNSLGIVYKQIGDYSKSQSYYLKILKLVDSLNLSYNISSPYSNLGILYDLIGEPKKAADSYKKALEVYKGNDYEDFENNVLNNLAALDFNEENYRSALDKFQKYLTYNKEKDNKLGLCIGYNNIASCYMNLKKWEAAERNYFKALQLAQQLSLKERIPEIYNGLSILMFRQEKHKEAIGYTNKSLVALDSLEGSFELKKNVNQNAFEIYEADNQLIKAIFHLKNTMAFKDSLMNETKIKEIQNLQIQHNVYVKDREIKANELQLALLNARVEQNKKRMIYFIVILILLLLSASLLYFRFLAKKKSNALLREKNTLISEQKDVISNMNRQLEKRMLRAQMNPHFIFNSLSSIQHLINTDNKKGALIYLSKFSKLLRQVLESSVNITLILREELELLKIYVELEALRFDDSFSYSFEIDEDLDIDKYEVPMLLVQPYIENAIIHGLMPKKGEKHLAITFKEKGNAIECVIEDNGIGMCNSGAENNKRISRGMSITSKRINALKKFTDQQLVKIESVNKKGDTGTKVTILIPKD